MGFPPKVKQKAMISSARHCCVCHRYKGVKMEVHHLIQEADGGPNTFENAIPVCFDCHSDAGHFNNRHAKGVKYSIPELEKARDSWYKFVKDNPITEKIIISKHIQTNYYVLHSFDILEKTLNNDFSSVNKFRSKTYFSSNKISNYWKEILKCHMNDYHNNIEQNLIIELRQFPSIQEYQRTYDNVELINKAEDDHPYYEAKRKASWSELINNLTPNSFLTQLSLSGINAEECCISLLYENGESCGGEKPNHGYTEYLEIPPISFVFLGITNATKEQIKLNTLNINEEKISLPNFNLLAYEMVLIPIATAFNIKGIDDNSLCIEHQEGDRGENFSRVFNTLDFSVKNVLYLKDTIEPKSLIYNNNDGEFEIEIHELDFNNLYSINSYWQCGSCPHLFFVTEDGKQEYYRELLQTSSNKLGEDFFQVPSGVSKVIIRELEDEVTFLDKIFINKKLSLSDIILEKGHSLIFDVKPLDKVRLKGYYIPFMNSKEKPNDMWLRNELVRKSNVSYNLNM